MKHIYLIFSLLCFSQLGAQTNKFTLTPDPNMISFPLEGIEHVAYGKVSNKTGGTLELLWSREDLELPQGWSASICDNNICYGPSVHACPPEFPNTIEGHRDGIMDVHVIDSGEVEEAHIVMTVFEKEDTTSWAKADYLFNKIVSNKEVRNIYTRVYPNPAYNSFSVDFNAGLTKIELYNLLGGKVISYEAIQNRSYDISNLPAGLYFVKLFGPNKQLLRTIRLQKRTIKA